MAQVRVTAVQDSPVRLDRAATLDLVDALTAARHRRGTSLINSAYRMGPPGLEPGSDGL